MTTKQKRFALDAAERVTATFTVAFLGTWLVNPGFDLDAAQAATAAGVIAVGTTIKVLAAKFIGSSSTAAWLPASDDTPRT